MNRSKAVLVVLSSLISLSHLTSLDCSKTCLNACTFEIKKCLSLCHCDELLKSSDSQESADTTDTALAPRSALFELKNKWLDYERENNQFKKYEAKLKKFEQATLTYRHAADQSVIDVDSCDMKCATQCIKPKNDLETQIHCFISRCGCKVKSNVTDNGIMEDVTPKTVEPVPCNQTCTSDCEVVRAFLDEQHYSYCMEKRCGCNQELVAQALFSEVAPQVMNSNIQSMILGVTLVVLALSIILGVTAVYMPKKAQVTMDDVKATVSSASQRVKKIMSRRNEEVKVQ